MITRLEVAPKPGHVDPDGTRALELATQWQSLPVTSVERRTVFKLRGDVPKALHDKLSALLVDHVLHDASFGHRPAVGDWVIRIGYHAGVTDNVGRTAEAMLRRLLGDRAPQSVHMERLYVVNGELSRSDAEALAGALANPLIERIAVWPAAEYSESNVDPDCPRVKASGEPTSLAVELPSDDAALQQLSDTRLWALSLAELHAIRDYYANADVRLARADRGLPEQPTDIEIEALAQTWSEHCKHKIFNAEIHYRDGDQARTIDSLFSTYIKGATKRVAQNVDWLVSVFHDNAGVIRADPQTHLVFKVETHNSPSALDPYGGAMTGIVGVNRDPFGTGIGARLLANTWGYCFGPQDYAEALPPQLMHPRRIRDGVHHGVIDGGNQSGIPYLRGFEIFESRFVGKPLVFCGTVGVMPPQVGQRKTEEKRIEPGDVVVMIGGRVGKDGLHGATFSSAALDEGSPVSAVQIGDPITQKKMFDMLLEARDAELYRSITDNGAGGLSSSVGELATLSGGAELDLDKAPLKYEGLAPWEILLSEAQERMTLAVPPERLPALLALAEKREVEATAIGKFTDHGRLVLRYQDKIVGDLPLDFLHDGCPQMSLEATWQPPAVSYGTATFDQAVASKGLRETWAELLQRPSLQVSPRRMRKYDHEVKGLSVIKPLVGVARDVPSEASVMRHTHGKPGVVLLSEGVYPELSDHDPGLMGGYVVDWAVRRLIASGATLGAIAGLDNFCWPDPVQTAQNPDGAHKLAGLVRCCEALHDTCVTYDVPLISGKDSMKNDAVLGGKRISIPPTLLFSAMAWRDDTAGLLDIAAINADATLFSVGTASGVEASEAWRMLGGAAKLAADSHPVLDPGLSLKQMQCVADAIDHGWISAAHAIGRGGMASALSRMVLASGLGASVKLATSAELFAEGGSRFLLAVHDQNVEAFEQAAQHISITRLGQLRGEPELSVTLGQPQATACMRLDALRAMMLEETA